MVGCVSIDPTLQALGDRLGVRSNRIEVKPYCYDERIGWTTHIVTIDGQAVGFTDGPCTEPE